MVVCSAYSSMADLSSRYTYTEKKHRAENENMVPKYHRIFAKCLRAEKNEGNAAVLKIIWPALDTGGEKKHHQIWGRLRRRL